MCYFYHLRFHPITVVSVLQNIVFVFFPFTKITVHLNNICQIYGKLYHHVFFPDPQFTQHTLCWRISFIYPTSNILLLDSKASPRIPWSGVSSLSLALSLGCSSESNIISSIFILVRLFLWLISLIEFCKRRFRRKHIM